MRCNRTEAWRKKLPRHPVPVALLGDVAPVGDSVYEMREFFGPGWRMYYVQHGDVLIVMLGGGDKSTQPADIAKAKRLAIDLEKLAP